VEPASGATATAAPFRHSRPGVAASGTMSDLWSGRLRLALARGGGRSSGDTRRTSDALRRSCRRTANRDTDQRIFVRLFENQLPLSKAAATLHYGARSVIVGCGARVSRFVLSSIGLAHLRTADGGRDSDDVLVVELVKVFAHSRFGDRADRLSSLRLLDRPPSEVLDLDLAGRSSLIDLPTMTSL